MGGRRMQLSQDVEYARSLWVTNRPIGNLRALQVMGSPIIDWWARFTDLKRTIGTSYHLRRWWSLPKEARSCPTAWDSYLTWDSRDWTLGGAYRASGTHEIYVNSGCMRSCCYGDRVDEGAAIICYVTMFLPVVIILRYHTRNYKNGKKVPPIIGLQSPP